MNQSRRIVVLAVSALAGASMLALGGCNSGGHLGQFRSNPTPELDTLGLRKAEVDNRTTITFDTNSRALRDDLRRALLIDRPTRLTGHPAMY